MTSGYLIIGWDMFFFLILLGAVVASIFFIILLLKFGKPARKLGFANIKKKATALLFDEAGTCSIVSGKMTGSGHLQEKRNRAWQILQTDDKELSKKTFWAGTGTPVFVGAQRKSVVASPNVLKAVEVVEAKAKDGVQLPADLKEWAEDLELEVEEDKEREVDRIDGEGKPIKVKVPYKDLVVKQLLNLEPLKLLMYFKSALDTDAEDVLLDKAYRDGLADAEKSYMKMGLVIGVCVAVGLAILGLFLASSGGV